jgi:hypothetical protein
MPIEDERPPDDKSIIEHTVPTRTVANVSERVLQVISGVAGITAVARGAAEVSVVGPVIAAGVSGLLPIAIAAVERRKEERSTRVERAQAWADEAWDAVVAARRG